MIESMLGRREIKNFLNLHPEKQWKSVILNTLEIGIELIKKDVEHILTTLGMDLTDDSLKGTPNRVAKMFVKELFGFGGSAIFSGIFYCIGLVLMLNRSSLRQAYKLNPQIAAVGLTFYIFSLIYFSLSFVLSLFIKFMKTSFFFLVVSIVLA